MLVLHSQVVCGYHHRSVNVPQIGRFLGIMQVRATIARKGLHFIELMDHFFSSLEAVLSIEYRFFVSNDKFRHE
jgi:hypothetical protein